MRGQVDRIPSSNWYIIHSPVLGTVKLTFNLSRQVIESRDVNNGLSSLRQPPKRPQTPGLSRNKQEDDGRSVVTSRLSLIDLAGSEKATSQADRRVEGAFINKSLLTLEKVIAALTEDKARSAHDHILAISVKADKESWAFRRAHVPYRDSKLTQILQPSLSGEARVAVICTINPSCIAVQESTSTLKFAQRVKKVTLHAERNEVVGDKALLIRYEQTVRLPSHAQ
jgi:centromeric protein E